jgi:hypothetical protein
MKLQKKKSQGYTDKTHNEACTKWLIVVEKMTWYCMLPSNINKMFTMKEKRLFSND